MVLPCPEETRLAHIRAIEVILSDGKAWGLALPAPRVRPCLAVGAQDSEGTTRIVRLARRNGYPFVIEKCIEAFRRALQSDNRERQYQYLFAVALSLLRRAHAIDEVAAAQLLSLPVDDWPGLAADVVDIVLSEPSTQPLAPRTG